MVLLELSRTETEDLEKSSFTLLTHFLQASGLRQLSGSLGDAELSLVRVWMCLVTLSQPLTLSKPLHPPYETQRLGLGSLALWAECCCGAHEVLWQSLACGTPIITTLWRQKQERPSIYCECWGLAWVTEDPDSTQTTKAKFLGKTQGQSYEMQ